MLFHQFSSHMHALIKIRLGDFIGCALLLRLSGNFCFCSIQGQRGCRNAFSKAVKREARKGDKISKKFDFFS